MTSQCRGVTPIAIAVIASAGLCASAQASPLLSGYGGPGQGSQAVLGAALVNGPSGGGGSGRGSGGGGSGGGGAQSAPAATASPAPPAASLPVARAVAPGGNGPGAGAPSGARALHSRGSARAVGSGSARRAAVVGVGSLHGASALPSGAYPASERSAAASSGVLGLSGGDLLEALLVLCALGLAVVAMRRLSERPGGPGRPDERLGTGS